MIGNINIPASQILNDFGLNIRFINNPKGYGFETFRVFCIEREEV